jgi:hypothetical protein
MTYRRAEEPPPVVRHLEKPACPPPRIAADLRIDQIAHDCPRLIARGRPVRQLDALLVGHHALAEAEMEKVMRHDLLPPLDKEMDLSEATPCSHVAAVGSICDIGTALIPSKKREPRRASDLTRPREPWGVWQGTSREGEAGLAAKDFRACREPDTRSACSKCGRGGSHLA